MNLLLIIGIVVAVLVLIGATQRKKLTDLFRSTTNSLIEKGSDPLKIIKLRIEEAKASAKKAAESAAELYATEMSQQSQYDALSEKHAKLIKEAKDLKDSGNSDKAKAKLEVAIQIEKQMANLSENISKMNENRIKLETKIIRIKAKVEKFKAQYDGLKARKEAGEALRKVTVESFNGDNLEESLGNVEELVSKDENKLSYQLDNSDEEEEDYSADVDDKFKDL
jgi:phage shock protein A